jgi:sulfate adenylyltransferase subunit 1 (EFTu-like GTPase family)
MHPDIFNIPAIWFTELNAQLMIILVDARNGSQNKPARHTIIASLNMPFVVVAINKMDLVEFPECL